MKPNFVSSPKEGVFLGKTNVFFVTLKKKWFVHILLHCTKMWILYELLFSFFSVLVTLLFGQGDTP